MWAAAPESGKYGVCICSLKPESSELGLREVQLRIKWPPADILCATRIRFRDTNFIRIIIDFLKVEDSDPHKNGPHPQQGIQFYFYLARRTCMAASRA